MLRAGAYRPRSTYLLTGAHGTEVGSDHPMSQDEDLSEVEGRPSRSSTGTIPEPPDIRLRCELGFAPSVTLVEGFRELRDIDDANSGLQPRPGGYVPDVDGCPTTPTPKMSSGADTEHTLHLICRAAPLLTSPSSWDNA
jgi:hypothetical protein